MTLKSKTCETEDHSVKNKLDKELKFLLIFHTTICAGASQIVLMTEEKSLSRISLRLVVYAPEWRLK